MSGECGPQKVIPKPDLVRHVASRCVDYVKQSVAECSEVGIHTESSAWKDHGSCPRYYVLFTFLSQTIH